MKKQIEETLRKTARVHEAMVEQAQVIEKMAGAISEAFSRGKALYVLGNGGSAADSQHIAGELVGRFLMERRPLPCQAFTTDSSVMTAVANDYGFEQVFLKQVQAFVRAGDVVMGISTSGNSENVNIAMEEAARRGAVTLGMSGADGGRLNGICDLCLLAPSGETPRIQEAHQTIIHILCDLVEQTLFGSSEH